MAVGQPPHGRAVFVVWIVELLDQRAVTIEVARLKVVEEAAALAAVLPSPRRYNPVKGTRFMERRKSRIVGRMRASGYLPEEAETEDLDASLEEVISSTAPVAPAAEAAQPGTSVPLNQGSPLN